LWASQTIASYWLPPLMHAFQQRHPGVALSLTIGNTSQVARVVSEGEADVGFVEGDVEDPLLTRVPVGSDQLVLVAARHHALAGQSTISPSELLRMRWVLREPGSGTRQIFEDAVSAHGIDPAQLNVALVLPSNEAVRAAVEAGAGVTVISRLVASGRIETGALCELPLPFPVRHFIALRHADRYRSQAQTAFLDLISVG